MDLKQFTSDPYELMLGQIAILTGLEYIFSVIIKYILGGTVWLLFATFTKLPVSPSQSLIGSILGFAVVRRGIHGVNWHMVGKISKFFKP